MGHVNLEGAIDLHCHYGPDFVKTHGHYTHSVTALEAAHDAAGAGHAAVVLKAHDFPSAALAFALDQVVDDFRVFGGITLDYQVGSLNPVAVECALRLGAKIVWLPTVSSHQDYLNGTAARLGYPGPGVRVIDDDGRLRPEVERIFDLVLEHDAILATGHITKDEHFAVAQAFGRKGHLLVTHAGEHVAGPRLTAGECVALVERGAVIELTALTCIDIFGVTSKPVSEVADIIRQVGPDHTVLGSDLGWHDGLPPPAHGLRDYVDSLWEIGVPERDLRLMACDNPARLLGLAG